MTRKSKIILYFILTTAVIAYVSLSQHFGNIRAKKQFDLFFNSNLKGEIDWVDIKYHGVAFKLTNDINEYIFYPYTSQLNDKNIFNHFAVAGDSIVKPMKSDTLVLVKNFKHFKYTFQEDSK